MQAYSMVGSLMNMVAANVSQCFDFGGPSFTMDAACSSALVALHEGVWQLRAGLIDAAVVGGVYLAFTPTTSWPSPASGPCRRRRLPPLRRAAPTAS
jgi:acyl transferase domain-containing protein